MTTSHNTTNPYSVHPATRMTQEWIQTLPEKTGKAIDDWLIIARDTQLKNIKELSAQIKNEWKLGTNQALWIAQIALGDEDSIAMSSNEAYLQAAGRWIDEQYSGKKQHLRPVYDHILQKALEIKGIKASPTKTYLSFFRNHAIAQVKPTTNSRIDFGLALGTEPALGKLIETGGAAKGDRITHRIVIQSVQDVDDEVMHWLRLAFDKDA